MSRELPGSLNDVAINNPDLSESQVLAEFEQRLIAYRTELASTIGMTVTELHMMGGAEIRALVGEQEERVA